MANHCRGLKRPLEQDAEEGEDTTKNTTTTEEPTNNATKNTTTTDEPTIRTTTNTTTAEQHTTESFEDELMALLE